MSPIKEIESVEEFESDVLNAPAGQLVIVDFWGPWCMPCKQLLPHVEKYQEAYSSALFRKYNLGNEDLEEYALELSVGALPAIFFYRDGKKIHEFHGNREENLKRDIEQHLQ